MTKSLNEIYLESSKYIFCYILLICIHTNVPFCIDRCYKATVQSPQINLGLPEAKHLTITEPQVATI